MSPATLILVFFVIANLPWLTERVFLIYKLAAVKSVLIRLIELVVYYFVCLLVAIAFEIQFSGEVYQQGWEFFVTTFSLFLVLAVPGVVYRYQWIPINNKDKKT
ncbi:MAG: DUF2818 family protein [Gammaproteobacteria bacterium]|nr:DUF2818 family protein [Gammaproteobacteria bacterium]